MVFSIREKNAKMMEIVILLLENGVITIPVNVNRRMIVATTVFVIRASSREYILCVFIVITPVCALHMWAIVYLVSNVPSGQAMVIQECGGAMNVILVNMKGIYVTAMKIVDRAIFVMIDAIVSRSQRSSLFHHLLQNQATVM